MKTIFILSENQVRKVIKNVIEEKNKTKETKSDVKTKKSN
jgi:hypothetical protein